jgi:hypothetical protein
MDYKYLVCHDYTVAKNDGLSPFNADQERHEYSCLPGTLAYLEHSIEASCEELENGTGVVVTLRTDLPEHKAKDSLARLLVKQNRKISGLCLVATTFK